MINKKSCNDPENINLGRQSVSFVGGHGGLTVDYYALLHQVVSHSYSVKDGGKRTSNVNRMNIPENITSKEEIIEYLKANGFAEVFVCER